VNRRDFLKGVAVASLTMVTTVGLPRLQVGAHRGTSPADVQTNASGKRFRGTSDGRILESPDGGKTWQTRANFGEHCSILEIYERSGKIYAHIGIQHYSFVTESWDGRIWYTLNWAPRKA